MSVAVANACASGARPYFWLPPIDVMVAMWFEDVPAVARNEDARELLPVLHAISCRVGGGPSYGPTVTMLGFALQLVRDAPGLLVERVSLAQLDIDPKRLVQLPPVLGRLVPIPAGAAADAPSSTALPAAVACVCGNLFDVSAPMPRLTEPGAVPKPGDLTLCLRCARAYRFKSDLSVEPVDVSRLPVGEGALIEQQQAVLREFWQRQAKRPS